MTIRLHTLAIVAVLAAWPVTGVLAAGADPLKLPGAEPKPAAEGKPSSEMKGPADSKTAPVPGKPSSEAAAAPAMSEAQKYCQNVAAAAADARFAWQAKKLADVEVKIKQRLGDLETRQAEVKDILDRYNEAIKRAKSGLVDIYAKMKAETAASQLAAMDDGPAAAILSQLSPGKASAILNEIPAERAVRLVSTMSTLVPPPDGKKS